MVRRFKKIICTKLNSNIYFTVVLLRWCQEKVNTLELNAPLSVCPTLSVEQTLKIMTREGYDQLPVIDETG